MLRHNVLNSPTEEIVEKLAAILVGVEAVLYVGRESRINVTEGTVRRRRCHVDIHGLHIPII